MCALPRHFFVTGTDTGVGKTTVTVRLMQQLVAQGLTVIGMKPVASGCEWLAGRWQNEDVRQLTAVSNVSAPLELINPYCFAPPIAPHIAAAQAGVSIDFNVIQQAYKQLTSMADVVIVEGAGGVLVPLNDTQTIADLIQALEIPALLVVGMRLGCINHALLTAEILKQLDINLCAWVANSIDPQMSVPEENLHTLINYLQPPLLTIPFEASQT